MGCGASSAVEPAISLQQVTEMCADCCTRMEVLCAHTALQKPENFAIEPPPEVQELKKSSDGLYKAAEDVMKDSDKAAEEKKAEGGMFKAALGAATQVAGQVAGGGLMAAAQALEGISKDLEKPFQEVGQHVVKEKKQALYEILLAYINAFKFADPVTICRGVTPWSDVQYNNVKGDTISTTLHGLSADALCQKLLPTVMAEVQKHAVTKNWKDATNNFNKAYDVISKAVGEEKLKEAGVKKVECDIDTYVTKAIVKALAEKMAECEIATRKDSVKKDIAKPGKPEAFALVFSATPLFAKHYDLWKTESVA